MPAIPEFEPQPQETPLNAQAQQALTELLQAQAIRKRLQHKLDNAVKKLTDSAGQLNDRGSELKISYEKKSRRLQDIGDDIDRAEREEHDKFQKQVKGLTEQMDKSIQNVIDSSVWLDEVPQALRQVSSKSTAVNEAFQKQAKRYERQARGNADPEGDAPDEPEDPEEQPPLELDPSDAPSALLREVLTNSTTSWNSKTPTERYANNNDYTGYYRTVFDAKHPGDDAPPIPHASHWFAEEEGRARVQTLSQSQGGDNGDDQEDSDLEVARERIRTKCPITFLPFKDPWTSKKCPHSFEKDAIMDMLDRSTNYLPFTPDQMRELNSIRRADTRAAQEKEIGTPQVGCPECSLKLTKADLEPNPILARKVRRQLEAERKQKEAEEEDDDEEDDDILPGTQRRRPIGLGSSPPRRPSMKMEKIKGELAKRQSGGSQQAPRSSQAAGGGEVIDMLDDDEDEDNEDEDLVDD